MKGLADSMDRLGRLIALPLLILALALQGMAPAQAAAMPRDVFGQPICSGDGVRGQAGDKQTPMHQGGQHDCCAAACAAAFALALPIPVGLDLPAPRESASQTGFTLASLGPRGPPDRPPNARGPPSLA